MTRIVKLFICMMLASSSISNIYSVWPFPEVESKLEKITEKFAELVDELKNTLKTYQAKQETGDRILQQVTLVNENLDNFNHNFKNSILIQNNACNTGKMVAFAAVGCIVSCIGAKMLYDFYTKKLQDSEQNSAHQKTLSRNDYLYILAGIATFISGLEIIAKSDALAA